MLSDIVSIVVASSKVGKYTFKYELLQQKISLPLTTKELMDKQNRLDEVIDPVSPR